MSDFIFTGHGTYSIPVLKTRLIGIGGLWVLLQFGIAYWFCILWDDFMKRIITTDTMKAVYRLTKKSQNILQMGPSFSFKVSFRVATTFWKQNSMYFYWFWFSSLKVFYFTKNFPFVLKIFKFLNFSFPLFFPVGHCWIYSRYWLKINPKVYDIFLS